MEQIKCMTGHRTFVLHCLFTSDDQSLVTVSLDEVMVW